MTHRAKQQPPTLVTLPNAQANVSAASLSFPTPDYLAPDYLAILFATMLDRICPFQGFMLLDPQGTLMHSSPRAQQLCQALQTDTASNPLTQSAAAIAPLPPTVAQVVQCLIESRQLFPEQPIQLLQDESLSGTQARIRIQAEWIELHPGQLASIVVTLENRRAIASQRALFDAQRYHLTQRETEVWELSLLGLSYAQVGQELYISLNTVKRHMKNIRSKRSLKER